MFVKTSKVSIVRDSKTKIVTIVPAHELSILKLIHGEGNVFLINQKTPSCEISEPDEAERLCDRYGKAVVVRTFGELYKESIASKLKEYEEKPARTKKEDAEA